MILNTSSDKTEKMQKIHPNIVKTNNTFFLNNSILFSYIKDSINIWNITFTILK